MRCRMEALRRSKWFLQEMISNSSKIMSIIKEFEHLRIPLEAIKSATNNFGETNYLAKGGFGKVYRGALLDGSEGQTMVAVKRLDRAFGQGDPEFWKEVMMLSCYGHENLVSLIGFCDESGEKILVYEYVPRGSLDNYLSSADLTWIQRLKICVGAARGLEYLHNPNGTQQRVLHRDIKSSNILLDENWNAKISDFGLSKIGPANQQFTFLISNVAGTIGYCDPLYMETGLLTKESDVYSFGVVLFEVLCGRYCVISTFTDERRFLPRLAKQCYENNNLDMIIHDSLRTQINPYSLYKFSTIGYRCLQRDREHRPLMAEIVKELEAALKYQVGEETASSAKNFTFEEISKHNRKNDCWIVVSGMVYDVTLFLNDHPGGDQVLLSASGKDATNDFEDVGHSDSARELLKDFYIGEMTRVVSLYEADQATASSSYVVSLEEVSKHNRKNDCWIIISGKVYDVTLFLDDHPGGDEVLLSASGKDASNDFEDVGHSDWAKEMLDRYYLADIGDEISREMLEKYQIGETTKVFTFSEVSKHNRINDCWVIISENVYDVTKFMDDHPGGDEVLLGATGKDATNDFEDVEHSAVARKLLENYYIGKIDFKTLPKRNRYKPPSKATGFRNLFKFK